eukprot:gene25942-47367_t
MAALLLRPSSGWWLLLSLSPPAAGHGDPDAWPINPDLGVSGFPDCVRRHPALALTMEEASSCLPNAVAYLSKPMLEHWTHCSPSHMGGVTSELPMLEHWTHCSPSHMGGVTSELVNTTAPSPAQHCFAGGNLGEGELSSHIGFE